MTALLIIVQARVGGTRLPGKVLKPLFGQPMLLWLLDRVRQMKTPHDLVVASPDTAGNHAIADMCVRHGYSYVLVPGNENDVLGRFQDVADAIPEATDIVRLCGDSPLIDPSAIDALVAQHDVQHNDHTGIAAEWPDGMDCEVFTRRSLEIANTEATESSEREHVTPYLWRKPQRFRCQTLPCPFDLRYLQTSVDTSYDLAMVEKLLERLLHDVGFGFGWRDVWRMIETYRIFRDWQLARLPRNSAYVNQIARERDIPVASWETERYR